MAENTKIEWCDATFNPWIGCAKVHAGCTQYYAETLMDHRYGKAKWGVDGTRNRTSVANWRKPIQWDRAAKEAGRPALVFCASLADVFEDRDDLVQHRRDLFAMVDKTPNLIWLMLTKRPENVRRMWPEMHTERPIFPGMPGPMGQPMPCVVTMANRPNVWLGTSPCNQETADKAIPELLKARDLCGGLFLSAEPLLGPINLRQTHRLTERNEPPLPRPIEHVDWVIVGGESGHGFRPRQPEWAESIRDQCQAADVPVFIKQMAGKAEIPAGLMVRQFPAAFKRDAVPLLA